MYYNNHWWIIKRPSVGTLKDDLAPQTVCFCHLEACPNFDLKKTRMCTFAFLHQLLTYSALEFVILYLLIHKCKFLIEVYVCLSCEITHLNIL